MSKQLKAWNHTCCLFLQTNNFAPCYLYLKERYCPSGSPSNISMRRSSRCSRPCDAGLLAFASRDLSWWRDCFSDYLYHWSRQSTWLELQGNCGVFRCKLWVSHSYVLQRVLISSFNSTHETNQRNTTRLTPNDIQTHWNCLGFKTPFALQSWWLIAKSIGGPPTTNPWAKKTTKRNLHGWPRQAAFD